MFYGWRLVSGVHLEVFRDRVDSLPEYLQQRGECRLGRQHNPRQQHDRMSSRHATTLLPDLARTYAPESDWPPVRHGPDLGQASTARASPHAPGRIDCARTS